MNAGASYLGGPFPPPLDSPGLHSFLSVGEMTWWRGSERGEREAAGDQTRDKFNFNAISFSSYLTWVLLSIVVVAFLLLLLLLLCLLLHILTVSWLHFNLYLCGLIICLHVKEKKPDTITLMRMMMMLLTAFLWLFIGFDIRCSLLLL